MLFRSTTGLLRSGRAQAPAAEGTHPHRQTHHADLGQVRRFLDWLDSHFGRLSSLALMAVIIVLLAYTLVNSQHTSDQQGFLAGQIHYEQTQVSALQNQLAKAQGSLDQANSSLEASTGQRSDLEAQLAALQADIVALDRQLTNLGIPPVATLPVLPAPSGSSTSASVSTTTTRPPTSTTTAPPSPPPKPPPTTTTTLFPPLPTLPTQANSHHQALKNAAQGSIGTLASPSSQWLLCACGLFCWSEQVFSL